MVSAVSIVFSVAFFVSGARAIRIAPSRSPFASQNDTVAQLASRYPAGPLLTHPSAAAFARTSVGLFAPSIGASTPSSDTAIDTAPSGICSLGAQPRTLHGCVHVQPRHLAGDDVALRLHHALVPWLHPACVAVHRERGGRAGLACLIHRGT